jgi:hypothetical protein
MPEYFTARPGLTGLWRLSATLNTQMALDRDYPVMVGGSRLYAFVQGYISYRLRALAARHRPGGMREGSCDVTPVAVLDNVANMTLLIIR